VLIKWRQSHEKQLARFEAELHLYGDDEVAIHPIAAMTIRVARWFIFKPKIPIGVNFGGSWIGKC
jgi:hypothetical protein